MVVYMQIRDNCVQSQIADNTHNSNLDDKWSIISSNNSRMITEFK